MFIVEVREYDMYCCLEDILSYEYHDEENANKAFEYIIETYLKVNGFNKETFKDIDGENFDEIINNKYATLFRCREQVEDSDWAIENLRYDGIGEHFVVDIVEREDKEDPVLDNDYLISNFMKLKDSTEEDDG